MNALVYAYSLITDYRDSPLWWHKRGLSYTRSGYGSRIPTAHMVRIGKRWHRVYVCIWSNSGTLFVRNKQNRFMIVTDSFLSNLIRTKTS